MCGEGGGENESKKEGVLARGSFLFFYTRAHLRPTLGREGFDRQRMYGEARRKANQRAVAVKNHKIPRSARGKIANGKSN
jgi:hypothetical protein